VLTTGSGDGMTNESNLLGRVLPAERITTLAGAPGPELLALTAAIALSVKTGCEIIPGWRPAWPGEVTVLGYEVTWVDWRSMVQDIADAREIKAPPIEFDARDVPCGPEPSAVERDPDADVYWDAYVEADVVASNSAAKGLRQ
jgi:hypothetical protein